MKRVIVDITINVQSIKCWLKQTSYLHDADRKLFVQVFFFSEKVLVKRKKTLNMLNQIVAAL